MDPSRLVQKVKNVQPDGERNYILWNGTLWWGRTSQKIMIMTDYVASGSAEVICVPPFPLLLCSIGPGFDSRRCQIFWVAVGLERGPLSPCEDKWGTTWKKSSVSGLENWDERPWWIRRADHAAPLYPQKLTLNFVDNLRSLSRYSSLAD
jgi:hypothetical protein